jgi:hypothetical protein
MTKWISTHGSLLTGLLLFGSPACSSAPANTELPAMTHVDPATSAHVVETICAGTCGGPLASMEVWRDAQEEIAVYVYDGDISRCSHPPRIWYDKDGEELATVASNPIGPGEQAPGPAIQTRLTAGLHQTGTTSCR